MPEIVRVLLPETARARTRHAMVLLVSAAFYWGAVYIYMPILAPYIKNNTGSLGAAGLVMGAYGLPQFLLRIPIGLFSDLLRKRKPFIYLGFLLHMAAPVGLICATGAGMLFLSLFAAGAACSMWALLTVLLTSCYPPEKATRSISYILIVMRVSIVFCAYAGGLIAERLGWTGPFYAALAIAFAGLVWSAAIAERWPEKRPSVSFGELFALGRSRRLLRISLLGFLSQFNMTATTFGFTPIFAQQAGASKEQLGYLLSFFSLFMTLAMFLAGSVLPRFFSDRKILAAGFLLTSGAVLLTPLASRIEALYLVQSVNGIGIGLLIPLLMGLSIQPFPKDKQATAMGFYQSYYALGMTLGPILSGWVGAHLGLPSIFILNGLLCLLPPLVPALLGSPDLTPEVLSRSKVAEKRPP